MLKPVTSEGCKLDESRTTFRNGVEVIEKVTESDTLNAYFVYKLYTVILHAGFGVERRIEYSYGYREKLEMESWMGGRCDVFMGWYDNEKFEGERYDSIPKGSIGDKEFWAKWGLSDDERCKVSSSSVAKFSSSSVVKSSSSRDGGSSSAMTKSSSSSTKATSSSSAKSSSSSRNVILNSSDNSTSSSIGSSSSSRHSGLDPESSSSRDGGSSSSMTKSSSSTAKSSSSAVKSSSSTAKSSSSAAKSSSSSKSNSLVQVIALNLKINVLGRNIQIDGAVVGTPFAVLDMQGRVLQLGYIQTEHLNLTVARAGTYLVKIGSVKQLVRVGN